MALGAIWGGFWFQVGGRIGAKSAPRLEEMGYQDDVNKSLTNLEPQGYAVVRKWSAVVGGPGP